MFKRKVCFSIATIVSAFALSFGALADGTRTETIGNISYSVPEDITKNQSQSDTTLQDSYSIGNGVILAQYVKGTISEGDGQKEKIAEISQTFEQLPEYSQLSSLDLTFQGNPATLKSFTYQSGETLCEGKAYVLYTGEGTAAFMYGCPSGDETIMEIENAYSQLTGSIRTTRLTDDMGEVTQSETETEPSIKTEFEEGIYKVGEEMPKGVYTLYATDGNGHITVSGDAEKKDVKLSRSFSNTFVVSADEGKYLDFSESEAKLAQPGQEADLSGEGMFEAGIHFEPGTYDLVSDDGQSGHFCIYSDPILTSIVAEGKVSGEAQVTVENGNCLELVRCHFKEIPAVPEKEYTDQNTIKRVQQALSSLGYDLGNADGIAGQKTTDAIVKYLANKGLTGNGNITDTLLESLGIQAE